MRDIWPLSERFDLPYVRRRHFPDNWTGRLSLLAVAGALAFVGYNAISGDDRAFSSGPLTRAHAMFADDCQQCHQPDPARAGFWLPPRDAACLRCHVATLHDPHQSLFRGEPMLVSARTNLIEMSGDCSACHVEHRGPDVRLTNVPDLLCIGCHQDLSSRGRQFTPPPVDPPPAPAGAVP